MRICFVCNEYPPGPHGGIGTMTQVLARDLVQAGHQVRVVGIYHPTYPSADYEVDQGVKVWRLREPVRPLGWVLGRYRLFRTISRWSRDGEIDLVELPDWEGWAAGWPKLPVPVIARLNGSVSYFTAELGQPINRGVFLLERASLRRADFWSSVSQYTADKTKNLFNLRSGPHEILYNPVEAPPDIHVKVEAKKQVVFTGTLTPKKGIISLIKAWPHVIEKDKAAELHVFGKDGKTDDGQSMKAFLLSQINGQAGKTVHFHGHVDRAKLFAAFQDARLAVFPSYAEAFALAPLESMSYGCPTVYSKRGSGPELIEHGKDGLLVDPDQTDDIAEAILRLLKDDELAKQLGELGREKIINNFSAQALLEKNIAFYESCINNFRLHTSRK